MNVTRTQTLTVKRSIFRKSLTVLIAPTAVVNSRETIGQDVRIGHCAIIEQDVVLCDRVDVQPFAHIQGRTHVGSETKIFSSAVIGARPQIRMHARSRAAEVELSSREPSKERSLIIGENCVLREHSTINTGSTGTTRLGNHVWLLAGAHVGHDAVLEDHVLVSNGSQIAGHVRIGSHTVVGGLAAVQQYCVIGKGAMLGGGAMVDRHCPPYVLVMGNRAEYRGTNLVGLRRRGTPPEQIACLNRVSKATMFSESPVRTAKEILAKEDWVQEDAVLALEFLMFVAKSEEITADWCARRASMGIVRPRRT
jgi:UDP-N-acetylglucosamine acyltransferase